MIKEERLMDERTELLEKLTAIEHEQWAHWTKQILSRTTLDFETLGYKVVFSAVEVDEYLRLIRTPYDRLSEREKDADHRAWASKAMRVFEEEQR